MNENINGFCQCQNCSGAGCTGGCQTQATRCACEERCSCGSDCQCGADCACGHLTG